MENLKIKSAPDNGTGACVLTVLALAALNQTGENVTLKFRNLHAHDWLSIKALQQRNAILTSMTICLEMLSNWFEFLIV